MNSSVPPTRLLLVEDDENDAILILASLRHGGLQISHRRVWTKAELQEALAQEPWSAVLCDYNLPQFDGLAALKLVRAHDADIPFIIVSGAIGEETAVATMRSGAQDFVMKQSLGRLSAVLVRELGEAEIRRAARIASSQLHAKEALLDSIVTTAADGIAVVNAAGRIEFANPALATLTAHASGELLGLPVKQLLRPAAAAGAGFWDVLCESTGAIRADTTNLQMHAHTRAGAIIPVEIKVSRMTLDDAPKLTVVVRDVSERARSEERMWRLAHFDELSGLPNRLLFRQLLEQAIRDANRERKSIAVLFIDLDRFKLINDTLGQDGGDMVLRQVAGRLRQCLREADLLSRFSGDEFAALLREIDDPEAARASAQRVLTAVAQPYDINGETYHLSASIGISIYPGDSPDATALLRNAELAMYRAKDQGKNNFQFHSPQMNSRSLEYVVLERSLRRAIELDEFMVHFQPQFDVTDGRIVGAEALLRWNLPEVGMIPPVKFIPLAEETGLIVPIGRLVLMRACMAAKKWQESGLSNFRVAVNLSPRQFNQSELVIDIINILEDTGLPPENLELEITESMVMANPESATAILRELRAVGVHLAIDDFGTGYSSLGYLKSFPVHTLKIDRSFIKDIPADPDDVAITQAIIAMGHSLRLEVVAEGVESAEQLDFLRKNGCDFLQGYLVGMPMSAEEFNGLLAERTHWSL
jgi:diguanylate cyclase (GGDEF)-like protein/PAS domain S-box-containing protein